jgi:ABC-2 type transport system ATP-binding protein
MQEVQALCKRVVVIHKGEIVADDTLDRLLQQQGSAAITVEFEGNVSVEQLRVLPGVADAQRIAEFKFNVQPLAGVDLRPELFRFAADNRLSLIGLKQDEGSLENIFRELTTVTEVSE